MAQLKVSRKYRGGEDTEIQGVKRKGERKVRLPSATTKGGGVGKRTVAMGCATGQLQDGSQSLAHQQKEWNLAPQLGGLKPCAIPKLESPPLPLQSTIHLWGGEITAEMSHTYIFPIFTQTSHQRTQKKFTQKSGHPKTGLLSLAYR